jgi:thiosulfate reductase cytochrome b subunit
MDIVASEYALLDPNLLPFLQRFVGVFETLDWLHLLKKLFWGK